MTKLYIPTGATLELEDCDVSRLAFEYRAARDQETLSAIADEIEKRAARLALWPELVQALGEQVENHGELCPGCGRSHDEPHTDDCKHAALLARARELE